MAKAKHKEASFFEKKFGYKPKPVKISNKKFNSLPSYGDMMKARQEEQRQKKEQNILSNNIRSSSKRQVANSIQERASFEEMPLNKFIAKCGICSRREAVDIIKEGRVRVNSKLVIEPAYKVNEKSKVTLDGKPIYFQGKLVYLLLNKPKDYITTVSDERGRKTVMQLVANACDERVYPVGRLDRNTSGLLLLTNDGELAQKLSHPKYEIKKIYQVSLDRNLTKADFEKIIAGLELEDGKIVVDELAYIDADKSKIGVQIHSGKNRIVRRIFESLGYDVKQLDRVMYANLTKKNLPRGRWRHLTDEEVRFLKFYNNKKKFK